jgi:hypothetical protein
MYLETPDQCIPTSRAGPCSSIAGTADASGGAADARARLQAENLDHVKLPQESRDRLSALKRESGAPPTGLEAVQHRQCGAGNAD